MALFAQLDENNVVVQVIVFDGTEKACADFMETVDGIRSVWKKTTIDGSTRYNYAGIGHTFDPGRNAFILPKPSEDATLDTNTFQWVVPNTEE